MTFNKAYKMDKLIKCVSINLNSSKNDSNIIIFVCTPIDL